MPSKITESRIVCPFCGVYDSRSMRFDAGGIESVDDFDVKCGNCKRIFHVERHIQITYAATKDSDSKATGVAFSVSTENL